MNTSFEMAINKIHDESVGYQKPQFENLLRSYNSCKDHSKKKKPFNRFTKGYGNFFEKNIFKKKMNISKQ